MVTMKQPAHAGQFIRMEVLEPLELSVTDAAKILKVTRPTLSNLLNGHAALTPEMAIRVEKAFGVKMETLVQMQTAYDIAAARAKAGAIKVRPYQPITQTAG